VPIAPRTFYAWVKRAPSKRALWDATIAEILAGYYEPGDDGRRKPESLYGSLKMWAHLQREGIPVAKGLASRCTSCCGLGGNSFSQRAALSGGEAGVVGDRWFVEPFILVVCLVGVEDPGLGPALDGAAVHFEALGELGCGEQALGAEPVGVAGQMVLVADVNDDAGGERLVLAGAVSGGVERFGRLGVGVGVQEPVECRDGVGAGLAGLPRCRWYRDGEAAGLSAAQTHVPVDAIGLVQGDVVDKQTNHAFAVPLRGVRVGPEGGESVVSERICCFTWSVSSAASAVVTRS
jgi:hypothetical protein